MYLIGNQEHKSKAYCKTTDTSCQTDLIELDDLHKGFLPFRSIFDLNSDRTNIEYFLVGKLYVKSYHDIFMMKPNENLSHYFKLDFTEPGTQNFRLQLSYIKPLIVKDDNEVKDLEFFDGKCKLLLRRVSLMNFDVMSILSQNSLSL